MIATYILFFTLGASSVHAETPCVDGAACPAQGADGGDVSGLLQSAVKLHDLLSGDASEISDADVAKADSDASEDEFIDTLGDTHKKLKVDTDGDLGLDDGGSPTETVKKFCDAEGVKKMHGHPPSNSSGNGSDALSENIMNDIAKELTDNSIDQMVKDIFSFYICVRWVPDDIFWKVAEQELSAEILQSVVKKSESSTQAIAELYQNFKFTPLLCSKNLKVYDKTSDIDHTYFTVFKKKVLNLTSTLSGSEKGPVWNKLKKADELFCNGPYMNSAKCDAKLAAQAFANKAATYLGDWGKGIKFETKEDKWKMMEQVFRSFHFHPTDSAWNSDFTRWKQLFPFHSFINKPQGVASKYSPSSTQRFLVCFGKRVASELHRRPRGDHIITDQNNVGCHGWWDAKSVVTMLRRTVALWKPSTCDIAEMSYVMKKQILKQFMRMNEQLFEALPSMLSDEELEKKGKLDEAMAGPPKYNVPSATVMNVKYFDGTRVAATVDMKVASPTGRRRRCWKGCDSTIKKGHAGTITTKANAVQVVWDTDDKNQTSNPPVGVSPLQFKVMPQEYGMPISGLLDTVGEYASAIGGMAAGFVGSFWGGQYSSLANMMSGSVAKWVVCPLAKNINMTDLDANLGTEDAVFREFVKEAYSKWTGFKAKMPGQECAKEDDFAPTAQFPGCQVCEFSELHVDFPERQINDDGKAENFMCPIKPPLSPAEQLEIFKEKSDAAIGNRMCLLHMTSNQNRQSQWHYSGHHPARKQNNVQTNAPRTEYEIVKLLDISTTPGKKQIAYGRTCSVEEEAANNRFCRLNEFHNPFKSVASMSSKVSGYLAGSLGMPVGAVAGLIGNYQQVMAKKSNLEAAQMIGEKSWNALMGLGRLAHSTGTAAAKEVMYLLPGSGMRHQRLEKKLFGASHGGDFLHGMSYQKPIGANNRTSNARARYRRHAVVCPCNDFDPAMEMAQKWHWSEVVLRSFREGLKHNPQLLDTPNATVKVRAEARIFFRDDANVKANNTWFTYGAAIDAGGAGAPPTAPCVKKGSWYRGYQCFPTDKCTLVGNKWNQKCVAKAKPPTGAWRVVWDAKLAADVGGSALAHQQLQGDQKFALQALTMNLYCGPKKSFGKVGAPVGQTAPLKQCMESGVRTNAAMKSEKPWKLYFPDEVIVVAIFGTIPGSQCLSTSKLTEGEVCQVATKAPALDSHLGSGEKSSVGGGYQGMRTGSDFPEGTLKEVVLQPEDVLEVSGLLL